MRHRLAEVVRGAGQWRAARVAGQVSGQDQRGRVTGITTAATKWVVAAIGNVAGAGFPVLAFIATAMVVITLAALGTLERRLLSRHEDDAPTGDER